MSDPIDLTPKSFELIPFRDRVSTSDLEDGNVQLGAYNLNGGLTNQKINIGVGDGYVAYGYNSGLSGDANLTWDLDGGTTYGGAMTVNDSIFASGTNRLNILSTDQTSLHFSDCTADINVETGEFTGNSTNNSIYYTGQIYLLTGAWNGNMTAGGIAGSGSVQIESGDVFGDSNAGIFKSGALSLWTGDFEGDVTGSYVTAGAGDIGITAGFAEGNVSSTRNGIIGGGSVNVQAGVATGTQNGNIFNSLRGGSISLLAGGAELGGVSVGNLTAGTVTISGGWNEQGNGGKITLTGGPSSGGNGNGGDILLVGGLKNGSGVMGYVKIDTGNSGKYAILDSSSVATSDKTFTFQNITGTLTLQSGSLTSTRVPYANVSGILVDNASLTFNGSTLLTPGLTDSGLTQDMFVSTTTGGLLQTVWSRTTSIDSPGSDTNIPTEKAVINFLNNLIFNQDELISHCDEAVYVT